MTDSASDGSRAAGRRPRVAALVTEYRRYSHGQNIVDRLLGGYGWGSRWHRPALEVVSLYVDQFPESDLSRERQARYPGLRLYPTIAEALTLGGRVLAVDGVLLIAEHGQYPKNDRGQTLYPRYEFFREVVEVFRASGRSVPVFCDKHLSWKWEWAREMFDTSRQLGFPLMAGSCVPVAWRIPSADLPWGAPVEEIVGVGVGGIDSYDIHALEGMQALVERRRGGETGATSIEALRGDAVWQALDGGAWDGDLFEACLCRSLYLTPSDPTHRHTFPARADLPRHLKAPPVAYRIAYADGLRATMLLLEGLVEDISAAARLADRADPFSVLFYLGHGHGMQPNFFNPLCRHIEDLVLTGRSPVPLERTLLTTGLSIAGCESLLRGQALATPHLDVGYRVGEASTFRRS